MMQIKTVGKKKEEKKVRPKESLALYMKKNWQLYALMVLPMLFIFIFIYGAYFGLNEKTEA